MRFSRLACLLLLAVAPLCAADIPSADEQAAMIAAMRDYAAQYYDAMPNFICTRIVHHYESGLKHIHWNDDGKESEELSVVAGQERHQVLPGKHARRILTTEGEFGAYLTQVFNPASEAEFTWAGWDSIDGRNVATFTFSVDQAHSTKTVSNFGVKAQIPYHGKVWADPQSGTVLRVQHESDQIPSELQMEKVVTTVDYAAVTINGLNSILPRSAVTEAKDIHRWIKNEIEFTNYRQFQADSKITFGAPSQP